jgi:hypothetical protein
MPFSALSLVQEFCNLRGLPSPSALYGSGEKSSRQFQALLNSLVRDLGGYNWPAQTLTISWASVATTSSQGRFGLTNLGGVKNIIPDTFWNETKKLPIIGPLTPAAWQTLVQLGTSGPESQYTVQQNELLVLPVPTVGDTLSCVVSTDLLVWGTADPDPFNYIPKELPNLDDDQFRVPDEVLLNGLFYMWAKVKGEPTDDAKDTYVGSIGSCLSQPVTQKLSLEGQSGMIRPGINIPPGNWMVP